MRTLTPLSTLVLRVSACEWSCIVHSCSMPSALCSTRRLPVYYSFGCAPIAAAFLTDQLAGVCASRRTMQWLLARSEARTGSPELSPFLGPSADAEVLLVAFDLVFAHARDALLTELSARHPCHRIVMAEARCACRLVDDVL